MGQEINCTGRSGKKTSVGKALLETDYVLFRGDFRVKIPFASMTSVTAKGAWLEIDSKEAKLALELGPAAEKWVQKILHPPSRMDKLGVREGLRVSVAGVKDAQFAKEIEQAGADLRSRVVSGSDIIFHGANEKSDLDRLDALSRSIHPAGAIWIIYPKGVRQITEMDVLTAIRAAGLKDVKVASFSATHTALKAVIPVSARSTWG
jgi:hypothetical protein